MSDNIRFTTVRHLIKKLLKSNKLINSRNVKPFPKEEARWLSHYKFRKENVSINDDGSVPGGIAQLICSTIDFSFIRSIAAVAYSIFGGPCYDPPLFFSICFAASKRALPSKISAGSCTILFADRSSGAWPASALIASLRGYLLQLP